MLDMGLRAMYIQFCRKQRCYIAGLAYTQDDAYTYNKPLLPTASK